MRIAHLVLSGVLFSTLFTGCGPTVSEVRTANYPGRGESCQLQFIKMDNATLSGSGEWEVIGQVVLSETGIADPYAEKYRQIVRPRACRMGGEAVSVFVASTNQGVMASGSSTSYAVLRKRTVATDTPQQF